MSGRWVCTRCYESNEADAVACSRCGLARGADLTQAEAVPAGSAAPWAPVASQPRPRPAWLALLRRFGWVGVVVVVAAVGAVLSAHRNDAGAISTGGTLQVQDLRIGACFNLKDEAADSVSDVDAKPCTEAHRYELYHVANMSEGDYPSDDQLSAFVEQECVGAFATYVGLSYDTSTLDVVYFTPSSDAWKSGDRSVQCAAYDPGDTAVVGTLHGAAR
jgi:hypothetical protein